MRFLGTRHIAFIFGLLCSIQTFATDRYVTKAGVDTGDCSANPCLTIRYAREASVSGDTIHIGPGKYVVAGPTNYWPVDKTLKFFGAQKGIDARTRTGDESVLLFEGGILIRANSVTFDGFTLQGSLRAPYYFGIQVEAGFDGTQILNNIIEGNGIGVGLANAGGLQAVISRNLFRNNITEPDSPTTGMGIYTDSAVSGATSNVLISDNTFTGHPLTAIALANTDPAFPLSNIVIKNNSMSGNGGGILIADAQSSQITKNSITDSVASTYSGGSVGIGFLGADKSITASLNKIENGPDFGIAIFSNPDANNDLRIHQNSIINFGKSGLWIHDAPIGQQNFATCNWWGSASGPTSNTVNPRGTGTSVDGDLRLKNVSPWLKTKAPNASCNAQPSPPTPMPPTPPRPLKPSLFSGTWENAKRKNCISILAVQSEALSFSKCGSIDCKKMEGTFHETQVVDSQAAANHAMIKYDKPSSETQKLTLVKPTLLFVQNYVNQNTDQIKNRNWMGLYRKVDECHSNPKPPPPQPPHPPRPKPIPGPNPPAPTFN